jgi:hypothetical protein
MKYIDDICYTAGWVCVVSCCFGVDWRFGMAVMGIALEVTAFLIAKWGGGRK